MKAAVATSRTRGVIRDIGAFIVVAFFLYRCMLCNALCLHSCTLAGWLYDVMLKGSTWSNYKIYSATLLFRCPPRVIPIRIGQFPISEFRRRAHVSRTWIGVLHMSQGYDGLCARPNPQIPQPLMCAANQSWILGPPFWGFEAKHFAPCSEGFIMFYPCFSPMNTAVISVVHDFSYNPLAPSHVEPMGKHFVFPDTHFTWNESDMEWSVQHVQLEKLKVIELNLSVIEKGQVSHVIIPPCLFSVRARS